MARNFGRGGAGRGFCEGVHKYCSRPPPEQPHPAACSDWKTLMQQRILRTACRDETGLIARIAGLCHEHGYNIHHQDQFVSSESTTFFMRTVLDGDFKESDGFISRLRGMLPPGAVIELRDQSIRQRLAVLVTRESHCLGDILIKAYSGALDAEVVAVVGNYPDLQELSAKFEVPFYLVSHEGVSREAQEQRLQEVLSACRPDLIVLAKYMRILSRQLVDSWQLGRMINIHHSFLPAFVGARPYHQAFERGVKLIGATAHFVTSSLDQGPIICQDVIKVNHRYTPETMARAGRDVERMVLINALNKVLDYKVFIEGNKTIVF